MNFDGTNGNGNQPKKSEDKLYRGSIGCIDFIEDKQLNFNSGNAVKCIVRAEYENKTEAIADLQVALWHITREIDRLKKQQ